ncbi:hypothetical protein [Vreelandella lionensis]|uniref:hypothetical protein n=1 Tax=Vreelandella lionensis TaxID=1144478 RepID=UPI001FB396E0|nr:hypothetical protein [Halomonas lionensis]
MSLQRAYVLLAGLYSLLPVIGIVAVFSGGGTPLAMAYLFFGALGVVGLWGYVLKRSVMSQRMWRPLAGVFVVGSVVQLVIMLTMPVSGVLLTWMLPAVSSPCYWRCCFTIIATATSRCGRLMKSVLPRKGLQQCSRLKRR